MALDNNGRHSASHRLPLTAESIKLMIPLSLGFNRSCFKQLLAFATLLQMQNHICWNSKCFYEKTTFGQEQCAKMADRFKLCPILELMENPRHFTL